MNGKRVEGKARLPENDVYQSDGRVSYRIDFEVEDEGSYDGEYTSTIPESTVGVHLGDFHMAIGNGARFQWIRLHVASA